MVFFTCNNCGDALKKKDCANHSGRCRPLALTCVDCHKDFFGDEFAAHTSCVTEAEKYGVKGFRSPAPSTAGLAKQEDWIRALQAASKVSGLTKRQIHLFDVLSRHSNVPRKKKQFHNFAKSVWRPPAYGPDVVDQVYDMLEAEMKKIKGLSENAAGSNVEIKDKPDDKAAVPNEALGESCGNGEEKKTDDASIIDSSSSQKKIEKKQKKAVCDNVAELEDSKNETLEQAEPVENGSKRSKRKKLKQQLEEEVKENGNDIADENVNGDNSASKKSKKKKRKHQAEEDVKENGNGIAGESVNGDNSASKKSKKKKRKHQTEDEVAENENGLADESVNGKNSLSKKSKKKKDKQKDDQEDEAITTENGFEGERVDDKGRTSKKDKSKKKLSEVDEKGVVQTSEDSPKKSRKKHKKSEENATENAGDSDSKEEVPVDASKKKKAKKMKHMLQDALSAVPAKKSKSTVS